MVTIDEIAKLSKVSISTVSKALNGYADISEKTRQRIIGIADELGYMPNATAQSLVRKRSNTVGIVYDVQYGLKNLFFSSVLEAFRKNVESKGYDILLLSHNSNSGLDYLRHCHSKNVDAVLVISGDNPEGIQKLYQSQLAVLTLDPIKRGPNSIFSDSYQSVKRACKYLHDLGHKRIAFVNGSYTNFIGLERLKAYLDFMHEHGLETIYLPEHSNEKYNYEEGYATMKMIFEAYGLPEAVCSVSDLMAIGAINYLNSHGFSVPEDVSVIGFDDLQVCEIVTPKLTTIRQDFESLGKLACETLIGMVEGEFRTIEPIVLDTEIIVRDSCRKRR